MQVTNEAERTRKVRRRKIPTQIRFRILARDGSRCLMCGRSPPEVTLHVDHVRAFADGGTDDLDNLATLCSTCNIGKAAYRFADYRDIHVSPSAIPIDGASLFAYTNAHSRPAAIAERIALRRHLELRNYDGDCIGLLSVVNRLGVATVLDLDNIVSKHAVFVDRISDYLNPKQGIDSDFVIRRALEIEAMERGALPGLVSLLSDHEMTSVSVGWMHGVFHAYEQIKASLAP
jgi:hypothetical protein